MQKYQSYLTLLSSDGTKQAEASKSKLLEAISGSLSPRDVSPYRIISKAELAKWAAEITEKKKEMKLNPIPTAAETLAAAVHSLVEQDQISFAKKSARQKAQQEEEMDLNMSAEDEKLLKATKIAMQFDPRMNVPTRIYVVDANLTVEEVSALLRGAPSNGEDQAVLSVNPSIDGVISIVSTKGGRTLSRVSARSHLTDEPKFFAKTNCGDALAIDFTSDIQEEEEENSDDEEGELKIVKDNTVENASVKNDSNLSDDQLRKNFINRMSKGIRELHNAACVGGLEWNSFTFNEIACDISSKIYKPISEFTEEFKLLINDIAIDKCLFKRWLSISRLINIPAAEEISNSKSLLRTMKQMYQEILSPVNRQSITVGLVVFAMKETVAVCLGEKLLDVKNDTNSKNKSLTYINYGDTAKIQLASSQYNSLNESSGNVNSSYILGIHVQDVENNIWKCVDLPGVGNDGRKGMPVNPKMPVIERGIRDTEVQNFTRRDIEDIHFAKILSKIEDLLQSKDNSIKWKDRIRCRKYAEVLNQDVLPQRLTEILSLSPVVYKYYYEPSDKLILIAHMPTADGRYGIKNWTACDNVRHCQSFSDWRVEKLSSPEFLTPRTIDALSSVVSLSSAELSVIAQKVHVFFPADQSIVKIYETPYSGLWVSVYKDRNLFGFRPLISEKQRLKRCDDTPANALCFYSNFYDGSVLFVKPGPKMKMKPDGCGTFVVSNTFPNGLIISACSDGSIQQQYYDPKQSSSNISGNVEVRKDTIETSRKIVGKGTVILTKKDGSQQILYASGKIATRKCHDEYFIITEEYGNQRYSNGEECSLGPISYKCEVDAQTKAVVVSREDGVLIVTHTNGSRVTHHADGTLIFTNDKESHILVKKKGFADIFIDVEINDSAIKHAKGEKVAIKQGGICTRSTAKVYDGTIIELLYDTRVVADVNGMVLTKKSDGTNIHVYDNGKVEYVPTNVNHDIKDQDSINEIKNGIFYFYCLNGQFQMYDCEHNAFNAKIENSKELSVNLTLAGQVSEEQSKSAGVDIIYAKAVTNDPIEPFVLLLQGNGSGIELLRDKCVKDYLNLVDRDCRIQQLPPAQIPTTFSSNSLIFDALRCQIYTHLLSGYNFDDKAISNFKEYNRLINLSILPVTARKYLPDFENKVPVEVSPIYILRKLCLLNPLNEEELNGINISVSKYLDWEKSRYYAENEFEVLDPREEKEVQHDNAIQKRIITAYKALRAKKKQEKQREKGKRNSILRTEAEPNNPPMAAVQEEDENERDSESDEENNELYFSGDSDADSRDDLDVNIDDEYNLSWTAFGDADVEGIGKLTFSQTRKALVHALGTGVSIDELKKSIELEGGTYNELITFDIFTRILAEIRDRTNSEIDNPREKTVENSYRVSDVSQDGLNGTH